MMDRVRIDFCSIRRFTYVSLSRVEGYSMVFGSSAPLTSIILPMVTPSAGMS
jgi:hypothetical protein